VVGKGNGVTEQPLVSIGLPTFNRASGLQRAAASVLAQSWPALELMISDNASTDETESMGRELAGSDPRVRYLRHDANIGAEANFRFVLEQARGELFMWLADDDWLGPDVILACARRLIGHPDHALVSARSRYFRDGETVFWEKSVNLQQSSPRARVAGFYRTVTLNGAFYGLMRREELGRIPPLKASIGADWLLVAAMAYRGKVATLPEVEINRSLGGASRDASSLARAYGLSPRDERNWHVLAARAVRREILDGDSYADLTRTERRVLALTSATLVITRFGWKVLLGRLLESVGLFDRARAALERRRRQNEQGL
jgi:glycosyltransferase involved in cell wall biosynthesis